MNALVQLLEKDPWVLYILLGLLVVVLFVIGFVVVFGVMQGREISIWPPKVGSKQTSTSADKKSQGTNGTDTGMDVGIIRYERDSHALDDVKAQRLRRATEEIWLVGASMHYTLNNSRQLLIEKVQEGVTINVFLADPLGQDYEATARSFGQGKSTLNTESVMSLAACRDMLQLIALSPTVRGALNVKLLDRVFTSGVYFYDPRKEDAMMVLVPHIPGHDAPLVPGFLVKRTKSGLLEDYYKIYSALWNKGIGIESWMAVNPQYLLLKERDA